MTEPNVSYKGLEDSSSSFPAPNAGLQKLVVVVFILHSMVQDSVDAFPTTTASVNHKAVNETRTHQSLMMIDSMSDDDIQDLSSSSDYESLPMTIEVEDCSADEYLDLGVCRNCTTCGPGTQHGINKRCGYGNGFEQICEPCAAGYYQERTSSSLVQCKRCITCDISAEIKRECSPVHNTECGPCQRGKYYYYPNVCLLCEVWNDREECMASTPTTPALTTPALTTKSTPPVPQKDLVTALNQTETPGNTTEQTTPDGGKRIFVVLVPVVTVFVVAIPLSIVVYCVYKLKKRRIINDEDTQEKDDAESGSKCIDPGEEDQARYIAATGTVRLGQGIYSPISQQELSRDGTDLSLPQELRSDLPFNQAPCSCNRQEPVGQDLGPITPSTVMITVGQNTPPSRR